MSYVLSALKQDAILDGSAKSITVYSQTEKLYLYYSYPSNRKFKKGPVISFLMAELNCARADIHIPEGFYFQDDKK